MKFQYFFIILFISIISLSVIKAEKNYNQDSTTKMLSIGDMMPNVSLSKLLNYPEDKAKFSDFMGKLVILDFWTVGCSGCIYSMPKMEKLQEQFGNQIQIILVTTSSEEKVAEATKRIKILQNIKLPSVVGDKEIAKLFPFRLVPTHVWISETGKVLQITNGINTTAEKIKDYLEGKEVKLPVKNQHKNFDINKPLWMEGNGRQLKYLEYYSYIMRYTPDAGGMLGIIKDPETKKNVRIKVYNLNLTSLVKLAYGGEFQSIHDFSMNPFDHKSRIILNVKDTVPYIYPKDYTEFDEWKKENLFCYELLVPPSKSGQIFEFMQQDLRRYFHIIGKIQKRKMKCLVLKREEGEIDKLKTKGGAFKSAMDYNTHFLSISNGFMGILLDRLQNNTFRKDPRPVIDETRYTGKIDIDLNANMYNDPEGVRKELNKYGLYLVEEEKEIDILEILEID